jgi:hypothetical protein
MYCINDFRENLGIIRKVAEKWRKIDLNCLSFGGVLLDVRLSLTVGKMLSVVFDGE